MNYDLDSQVVTYQGATQYDFDNEILLNWYPKRIVNLTKGANSILELGVGHGFSTHIFAKSYPRHLVLDGSSIVIQNFRERFPECNAEVVETYFENFNTTEKFDVIVLGFVLEHVEDPIQILSKYRKFLSPGGKIFVSVPNAEALNRRFGQAAGLLTDLQQLSEFDLASGHKRFYTVKTLVEEAKNAGFGIGKMEGIYLKPFTTKQILSLDLDTTIINAMCEVGVGYPELCLGILAEFIDAN